MRINNSAPLVSVYCGTYNQEDYIEDAIKGFINQKTTFPYEIVVHDDASTDSTADIVRRYADAYPDLVKPIIETENKYSRKIDFAAEFIAVTKSKYIAFCDGDDYWIDENKLQTQFDYMEAHPDCVCCGTEAWVHDYFTQTKYLFWGKKQDCDVDPKILLSWTRLVLKPSSWMIRIDALKTGQDIIAKLGGHADFALCLWMSDAGTIHYIHKPMIVYRFGAKNSYALSTIENNTDLGAGCLKLLETFNRETDFRYDRYVQIGIKRAKYYSIINRHRVNELKLSDWIQLLSLPGKGAFFGALAQTGIGKILRKFKHKVKRFFYPLESSARP